MTACTDKLFRTIVSSFVHGKLTVGIPYQGAGAAHTSPLPLPPRRGLGPPGPTLWNPEP